MEKKEETTKGCPDLVRLPMNIAPKDNQLFWLQFGKCVGAQHFIAWWDGENSPEKPWAFLEYEPVNNNGYRINHVVDSDITTWTPIGNYYGDTGVGKEIQIIGMLCTLLYDSNSRLEWWRELFPCVTGNDPKSYSDMYELYTKAQAEKAELVKDRDEWKSATVSANERFKLAEDKLVSQAELVRQCADIAKNYFKSWDAFEQEYGKGLVNQILSLLPKD